MSRANPKHPYNGVTVDMLRGVSASSGNLAFVSGLHTQVAASDTIVTGLKTVSHAGVSFASVGPTVKQLHCSASIGNQAGAPAAGSILTKTWKPTNSTNDATPVAATDFTDNVIVAWWAIGVPADEIDDAVA